MAKSVKYELDTIYEPLNGVTFDGTFHGTMEMPSTGKFRDVIKGIDSSTEKILNEISASVLEKYGTSVWKGITGPKDSKPFTECWLWAVCLSDHLDEDTEYRFRVTDITPFTIKEEKASFKYGVNISLKKIKEL